MIQAVLFDLDGTVLDTKESILQSFEYTLHTQGVMGVARQDIIALIGHTLEDIYTRLIPTVEVEILTKIHREWQVQNAHLYRVFANTSAALQTLRDRRLKIAAVTTRKKTVEVSLDRAGIAHFFDALVTGDTTACVKPNPESVLAALAALNVAPADAVMVGDTEVDIQAGKNAGTATVGVTYGFRTRAELLPHGADHLIDDISQLPAVIQQL